VVKLDPAGKGQADLLYAIFLGGDSSIEISYAVTIDSPGNVYVAGDTSSDDFPTSLNAYDETYNSGTQDSFWPDC
jgi:hypothetical protein